MISLEKKVEAEKIEETPVQQNNNQPTYNPPPKENQNNKPRSTKKSFNKYEIPIDVPKVTGRHNP